MSRKIAVVLKGYPRLSETFIAQELLGLQQRGLDFTIYSLRHPYDDKSHPVHDEITSPVNYLPEYLYHGPIRVLQSLWHCRRHRGLGRAFRIWWRDLQRDLTPNRVRRFGQALVLAAEMPRETDWIYVHFLHTPASVTRYAAMIRELPWSCSAHAKDIYTTPEWEKQEKLADMEWLVTCTRHNVDHLRALTNGDGRKVDLVYHGLDFRRLPAPRDRSAAAPSAAPIRLLSVGRAVEKKGYGDLLTALSLLPNNLDWRFTHIGAGDLRRSLKKQADNLAIADRVEWRGPMDQADVFKAYGDADIFVLASRIAQNGDRDGLPNVLMEAQSQGVAIVSTRVSAIPELIADGETGLLVEPGRPDELAAALERLMRDADLRCRLASARAERVKTEFGHDTGMIILARRFGIDPNPGP